MLMALINYYLKKTIKDFDAKVLNDNKNEKSLYVCQNCGRILSSEVFIEFTKVIVCPFCSLEFELLDTHIVNNNMNNNTNRLLKI